MKKILNLCLSVFCISVFCFTSCQQPANPEVPGSNPGTETGGEELTEFRVVWKGNLKNAPANPEKNWVYYNTTDFVTYIWNVDSKKWDILAKAPDFPTIPEIPTFDELVWKGDLNTAPENPVNNWAYYNTTDNTAYIYCEDKWVVFFKMPNFDETISTTGDNFFTCRITENGLVIGTKTYVYPDYNANMYVNGELRLSTVPIEFIVTDNKTGVRFVKKYQTGTGSIWPSFVYPLTKKGEEFDITIELKDSSAFYKIDYFTGIADGGIGCPKVQNADSIEVQFDEKTKIISYSPEPEFDFTDFDGEILDKGICYELFGNKEWGNWLWNAEIWNSKNSDSIYSLDLHNAIVYSGWRGFEFLDAYLMGKKIFINADIRVKLSGADAENTYIQFPIKNDTLLTDYQTGSKKNKVIVVYTTEDGKTTMTNEPGKVIAKDPSSSNEIEMYGEIVDFGAEFIEPAKVPKLEGYEFVRWGNMSFNGTNSIIPNTSDFEVGNRSGKLVGQIKTVVLDALIEPITDYNDLYLYQIIAEFKPVESETIDFYNDNTVFKSVAVEKMNGYCFAKIPTEKPTKEGYEFLGWDVENNLLRTIHLSNDKQIGDYSKNIANEYTITKNEYDSELRYSCNNYRTEDNFDDDGNVSTTYYYTFYQYVYDFTDGVACFNLNSNSNPISFKAVWKEIESIGE